MTILLFVLGIVIGLGAAAVYLIARLGLDGARQVRRGEKP